MTNIHPTAMIEDDVVIGTGTRVWANVQIRTGATIGDDCNIGRNCFVDCDVKVGDRVKVQNNSSLYSGVDVHDGVFIGPHVIFTNDKVPRAITAGGRSKDAHDWTLGRSVVCSGAAIGAGTVIVTGVRIGEWSMIGAGTVVTRDVPDHALVIGNPGRIVGYVSAGGQRCDSESTARQLTIEERDQEQ